MKPRDAAPWPLAAGAALACLGVYALTLAPAVGFIDSGELAAAAHGFGIPHPTGYPLFVWLAGGWSRLPIGVSGMVRLNLFSAVATAAAVFVCVVLAWRLLGRAGWSEPRARGAAALAAGLGLGGSRTVWSNALSLEVYPLHLLMLTLSFWLVARALDLSEPARAARAWRLLALVVGLSFANHLTMVQLVPALLAALALALRRGSLGLRSLPGLALFFGVGLLPYLHLPIRAAQDPAVNWGDTRTLEAFLSHVTAEAYRGRFFMGVQPFLASLLDFVSGLPGQSGYLLTALAVLGAARLPRRDGVAAVLLGVSLLSSVCVASAYAIPDIASYFLLALLVQALLAGYGVALVAAWLPGRERLLAPALAASVAAALLVANRAVSERGNFLVQDFASNMFRSLQPRALVITNQWDHWVSPALYLQHVEGVRRDVLIVDKRLCLRPWYVRQLARRYPDVCRGAQRELQALLASPDSLPAVDALLQALVDQNAEHRPVYVTLDVEPDFPAGYRQIPEGLALRLYRPDRLPPPDAATWDDFVYRPFPRRDGWTDRLRQYYAAMLMGRGAQLEDAGRAREAARYYERALGFEPSPGLRAQIVARLARARAAQP